MEPNSLQVGQINQNKRPRSIAWSIVSFIMTLIPIFIWGYCFSVSRGSYSENGAGAIWWLMVMYYWSLGLPLAMMSIAFGIVGLWSKCRWLSIISLFLKAAMVVGIAMFLFLPTMSVQTVSY